MTLFDDMAKIAKESLSEEKLLEGLTRSAELYQLATRPIEFVMSEKDFTNLSAYLDGRREYYTMGGFGEMANEIKRITDLLYCSASMRRVQR